ncbi:hypothetical protein [Algivirga pacifica]|uniref:hypothetical protein n=1 Tax=Algivirga pacifica TaxID=1162670 RepID=UPI0031E5F533
MKLTTILLSMICLWLSIGPACMGISLCQEVKDTCIDTLPHEEEEDTIPHCMEGTCSAFSSCGSCCVGFILPSFQLALSFFEASLSLENFHYLSSTSLGYLSGVFKPPNQSKLLSFTG